MVVVRLVAGAAIVIPDPRTDPRRRPPTAPRRDHLVDPWVNEHPLGTQPQVLYRAGQMTGVVAELSEPAVAVEAEYPADVPGLVVMVHMLRVCRLADGAEPTLLGEQLIELGLADPVPPPQVVLTTAAVEPCLRRFRPHVVAGLAVAAVTTSPGTVAGEIRHGLGHPAVGAESVPVWDLPRLPNLSTALRHYALGVAHLGTLVEAELAVAAATTRTPGIGVKLLQRLPLTTIPTTP